MTKKIIKLNASALKESSCLLRLYLLVIDGYKEKQTTIDIEYGSAFHKFAKHLALGDDVYKAMAEATRYLRDQIESGNCHMGYGKFAKTWMTLSHLTGTCHDFYEKVWKSPTRDFEIITSPSKNALVEMTFSIPFLVEDEVEVLIEGTIDSFAKISKGCICLPDYKTTSTTKQPSEYFKQYKLSPQLMLYNWAVRQYAKNYPDSIFAEMCRERIASCIYGIFIGKEKQPEFIRSEMYWYSDEQMEEFEDSLKDVVHAITWYVRNNRVPKRDGMLNGSCASFAKQCMFLPACSSPDRSSFEQILGITFKKQEYDPLRNK